MKRLKVIRHIRDIRDVVLEAKVENRDVDMIEKNCKRILKEDFTQFAYCIDTGEIITAIDSDGNLQVLIPEYTNI